LSKFLLMKTIFIFIVFLFLNLNAFGQLKENQIRVVGSYKETLKAKIFEVNFFIKETTTVIEGQSKVLKSFEQARKEVQDILKTEQLSSSELIFKSAQSSNFGRRGANYTLVITDFDKANKILLNEKVGKLAELYIRYVYDFSDEYKDFVSEKALEKAKSKAEFLATKSGNKIGKLIIIDDNTINKSSVFGSPTSYTQKIDKNQEYEVHYDLNVTYELLDK